MFRAVLASSLAALGAAVVLSPVAFAQPDDGSNSGTAGEASDTAAASGSAADEVERLQSEGRSVVVRGQGIDNAAPLEACDVAGTSSDDASNTVFVDVTCTPGYLD